MAGTLDRPGAWGRRHALRRQPGTARLWATDAASSALGSCAIAFTGEIAELYLLSFGRDRKVGSKLMKAMAGALLERGHRAVSL